MKKTRFSESQILSILKQQEARLIYIYLMFVANILEIKLENGSEL